MHHSIGRTNVKSNNCQLLERQNFPYEFLMLDEKKNMAPTLYKMNIYRSDVYNSASWITRVTWQ